METKELELDFPEPFIDMDEGSWLCARRMLSRPGQQTPARKLWTTCRAASSSHSLITEPGHRQLCTVLVGLHIYVPLALFLSS